MLNRASGRDIGNLDSKNIIYKVKCLLDSTWNNRRQILWKIWQKIAWGFILSKGCFFLPSLFYFEQRFVHQKNLLLPIHHEASHRQTYRFPILQGWHGKDILLLDSMTRAALENEQNSQWCAGVKISFQVPSFFTPWSPAATCQRTNIPLGTAEPYLTYHFVVTKNGLWVFLFLTLYPLRLQWYQEQYLMLLYS